MRRIFIVAAASFALALAATAPSIAAADGDTCGSKVLTHLDGLQARLLDTMDAWEGDEA